MGICLDTEQAEATNEFEEETWAKNTPRNQQTMSATHQPLHNESEVKFESPKVPVIFVLGGPGSGKVTHCDNLMQENKGITHINMTDLLQQYAIGNDMKDFATLSSKTVTEVLMLEMKMAPHAKTYLISGFPRNMRDVVEYSEKIQMINGAILISWRQKILERQIDYGAKLGQVVLSLARMELNNFYKNVIPVAEYFDQSNMLITVNGERHPSEVYTDFKSSVFRILGEQDNPPVFANGKVAPIPHDVSTELPTRSLASVAQAAHSQKMVDESDRPKTQVISVNANSLESYPSPVKNEWPPVIWIIGGPGSNKAALCTQVAKDTGWAHVSLGKLLRTAAEPTEQRRNAEAHRIKECISTGEMVPLEIVLKYVEGNMTANIMMPGIILDGFPRDMHQVTEFEAKFKQKPTIVLLDCSKLQLGRGRLDDSVTAFRRRLEIFRHSSLPMLKTMDQIGRLTIVDGDTDTPAVQEDFANVMRDLMDYIKNKGTQPPEIHPHPQLNGQLPNGSVPNGHIPQETEIEDLEGEPLETISQRVGNGVANGFANGVNHMANGFGHAANGIAHAANGLGHMANGNGPKKIVEKVANGLPAYTNLTNDRLVHNEVTYMDAHI